MFAQNFVFFETFQVIHTHYKGLRSLLDHEQTCEIQCVQYCLQAILLLTDTCCSGKTACADFKLVDNYIWFMYSVDICRQAMDHPPVFSHAKPNGQTDHMLSNEEEFGEEEDDVSCQTYMSV